MPIHPLIGLGPVFPTSTRAGRDTASMTAPVSATQPAANLWRGLLLVCLAGVVWGTIGPGVDVVHDRSGLSPLTISAYRSIAAVAVLLGAVLVAGRMRTSLSLARAQWRRVVFVGVLTAIFQLSFFVAVVLAGVSVTTVVSLGFAPVLLLILTAARRRRPPSTGQSLTVAMALVGLLLVSVVGSAGEQGTHSKVGLLLALGSGAAYAVSTEAAGPLSQRLDALTMTTATMVVAAVVLTPVGLILPVLRKESITTPDVGSWLLVVYLGAVTMALAYVLLFAGLRTTPSGVATVATLLEPVTAVLIAVLFLGEQLTLAGVAGTLLIVAAIGTLGRRAEEPAPQ